MGKDGAGDSYVGQRMEYPSKLRNTPSRRPETWRGGLGRCSPQAQSAPPARYCRRAALDSDLAAITHRYESPEPLIRFRDCRGGYRSSCLYPSRPGIGPYRSCPPPDAHLSWYPFHACRRSSFLRDPPLFKREKSLGALPPLRQVILYGQSVGPTCSPLAFATAP